MAKFNLDDYELVEDRLKKYWKDNPEGMISTNVVHITEDGTCVTIKADVTDNNGRLVATGIAQETKGDGFANTTSWVENCETSAIGRALANWKYQGNKKARPSREEMAKVERNSVTPTTDTKKKAEESVADSSAPSEDDIIIVTEGSMTPQCLSCGSELWDNRQDKASGKVKKTYPDWKCKDKNCTRIWYIDSYANDKKAPEQWYMPEMPKAKSLDDIKEGEAPF
jgi:hypothetical protein|tara:strand:- start:268 stop:942 length:675 start_codon:yes stop_codon:yes gene_type:complete